MWPWSLDYAVQICSHSKGYYLDWGFCTDSGIQILLSLFITGG